MATIDIAGTEERVRLNGIDAPEGQQTCDNAEGRRYLCGSRSAEHLASLIDRNGQVTCTEEDRDRYGRIVATCRVDGAELNAEMVRAGWALDYKQDSGGRYVLGEREAKASKRGMWAGSFIVPSDWRRGERMATEELQPTGPDDCDIKDNISGSGRIYHLPEGRAYPKTVIDVSEGERRFCSVDEAEAAGWREVRG